MEDIKVNSVMHKIYKEFYSLKQSYLFMNPLQMWPNEKSCNQKNNHK